MTKVLVVGARDGSIGWNIARILRGRGWAAITAGISGTPQEDEYLDAGNSEAAQQLLAEVRPRHVICTVGVNRPKPPQEKHLGAWYREHLLVNCVLPMLLLRAWQEAAEDPADYTGPERHYIAISSNSARVPRSSSAAYCASKAALSMALRVEAREAAAQGAGAMVVYGYEPGLVRGTPMTEATASAFPGAPLTRMRGYGLSEGVSAGGLAELVVAGLWSGRALNGCLVPYDAGEL